MQLRELTEREQIARLEQALLGAVLLRPATLDILPSLEARDFGDMRGQAVWRAFSDLRADAAPIDLITVEDQLRRNGHLEAIGGAYIGECAAQASMHDETVVEHANRVRDASLHRATLIALAEALERANSGELFGADLLSEGMRTLSQLDQNNQGDSSITVSELISQYMRDASARASRVGEMTGHPTGVAALDGVLGGWQRGIVSIVAARPGHGKSSLALATTDACSASGIGVHVFSLEDTRESYCERILARGSKVPADALRRMRYDRGQLQDIGDAARKLQKRAGWVIDDSSGISADEIVRSVRRHRKANSTQVVIVDYLQLLKRNRDANSTHESVGANLNILADAAKQDGMAYVVLSQLNRNVEGRDDRRPMVSDMRESGTIEERAKCVIGLYRGSCYGGPVEGIDEDEQGRLMSEERHRSSIQLLVLKNSNGPSPATVLANWDGKTTRIW
jgi:replicative DNA helicase